MRRYLWIPLLALLLLIAGGVAVIWPSLAPGGNTVSHTNGGASCAGETARAQVPARPYEPARKSSTRSPSEADPAVHRDPNATGTPDATKPLAPDTKPPAKAAPEPHNVDDSAVIPSVFTTGDAPDRTIGGPRGRRARGIAAKLAISPDGSLAATGSYQQVALWSKDSDQPAWTQSPGERRSFPPVAFSPDGRLLATMQDRSVALRKVDGGEIVWKSLVLDGYGIGPDALDLCFNADGTRVFCLWNDGKVVAYDGADGQAVTTISGISGDPHSIQWLPNQQRLCVVRGDEPALFYDLNAPDSPQSLKVGKGDWTLAFSEDGLSFVQVDGSALVRRSWPGGEVLKRVELDKGSEPERPLRIAPGRFIVRVRRGGADSIQLWDMVAMTMLHDLPMPRLFGVAANGNGQAATVNRDGTIDFWRIEADRLVTVNPYQTDPVVWAVWADGGRTIAAALENGRVSFRHADTGEEFDAFDTGKVPLARVLYSPRGDRLAVFRSDESACLVKLDTREQVSLAAKVNPYLGGFSGDGAKLWLAVDGEIAGYDATSGARLQTLLAGRSFRGFSVSPDETRLAVCTAKEVRLFELPIQDEGELIDHPFKETQSLHWSSDGRLLGVCDRAETVLWDVALGRIASTLNGPLATAAFNPAGTELAVADGRGSLTRWSIDGRKLKTLAAAAFSMCVQYSSDGLHLLCVGPDHTVRIWDLK